MEPRKLYRSESDRMLAGVCGGLANYLRLDSTVVRLAFILLILLGGHGLLIYLLLWILMPIEPRVLSAPVSNTNPSNPA
jgi:phage shock protein C